MSPVLRAGALRAPERQVSELEITGRTTTARQRCAERHFCCRVRAIILAMFAER